MSQYRVQFEVFEGPLDLLLHLVKKQEVDIYQVNLARIATDFVAHLEQMRELDLDIAGEFLVMAATLIYIKSRELLPVDKQARVESDDDDGDDPRWELIRRLVEYKKFKDAAGQLQERESELEDIYPRKAKKPELTKPEAPQKKEAASIFDLVHAVGNILKRYRTQSDVSEIIADPYTVSEKIESLRSLLLGRPKVRFGELFQAARSRSEVVVTFLALLELIRMRLVACVQQEAFGEIEIENQVVDPLEMDSPPPPETETETETETESESESESGLPPGASPPADFVDPTPIITPENPPDANPLSSDADTPRIA